MVDTSILYALTGVSMILAIGIGANDETFAPVVGSKRLTVNQSVLMGGIIVIIGAVIVGFNVAETASVGIVNQNKLTFNERHILVIFLSVAFSLIIGSWKGLPLSTTHAMVGAITSLAVIITGNTSSIYLSTVFRIILSWFISPLLGFIGSYLIMKGIARFKKYYINGLDDVDRLETIFSYGLIGAVSITAFSRGGNDVSNAVAPILPSYIRLASENSTPLLQRLPLLLGGIGMMIGLILIGRRVLRTVGNEVVELSPTTALAVQLATAVVTFTAASIGIPISGTHVLVASFVGTGIASNSNVNMNTVKKIAVSAVGTPFFSAFVTFFFWNIFLILF